MPTPLNSPHSRISWLAIGAASAAVFAVAASAANAPVQKPPVIHVDVTQGPTTVTNKAPSKPSTPAATSGDRSGKGGKGPTTPTQPVVNKATDSQFTFTVTNLSKTDYTGITIEYHVYNKTITHNNGLSTTTVEDITDTVPVPPPGDDGTAKPLAAGAKCDIITKDIPGMVKSPPAASSSSGSGSTGGSNGNMYGGGGRSRSSPTKTAEAVIPDTTTVMGTSYIIYWNGKDIGVSGEDPFDVIDTFKQYQGMQH